MRIEAIPQVAIAHCGSALSTSRKAFSPAEYQKECSMATARSNAGCTFGSQLDEKDTLPSGPVWEAVSSACARPGTAKEKMNERYKRRRFMILSCDEVSWRLLRASYCAPGVAVR